MMNLYNEVDNKEKKIKYRLRFEYLVCLVPGIGNIIGLVISIFSGHIKYYITYIIYSIFFYLTGGALTYLTIQINNNIVSALLSYIVIITFWLIIPLYVLYKFIFYVDELVLLKYIQKGYVRSDGEAFAKIEIPFIFKWWQ